jgi:hypothetical protein
MDCCPLIIEFRFAVIRTAGSDSTGTNFIASLAKARVSDGSRRRSHQLVDDAFFRT